MKQGVIASVLVFCSATVFMVQADTGLTFKRSTAGHTIMGTAVPASEHTVMTWIGSGKARIEERADTVILFDPAVSTITFLDMKAKSYTQVAFDKLDATMQEAVKGQGASDEEAAAMARMMQQMMGAMKVTVSVTLTGEQKKIGSWNCRKYALSQSMGVAGTTTSEIWTTTDIPVDQDFYANFRNYAFVKFAGFDEALEELKKIKGVPVLITGSSTVMGTEIKSREELLKVENAAKPASFYEVPAGFKKIAGTPF